ncbi:MAG: hypothetical protein PVJ34_15700 [Anaerolineae bacterium]|jgi:hypothetical protein
MALAGSTWQEIENRLAELPPEDLPKVLEYIQFLTFQREQDPLAHKHIAEEQTPYRVVANLEGLLKDYPIADEDVATARKEMWAGFGTFEP